MDRVAYSPNINKVIIYIPVSQHTCLSVLRWSLLLAYVLREMSVISLIHRGFHPNSKSRLGWAGAAEMFHSSATMPERHHFTCKDVMLLLCPWV